MGLWCDAMYNNYSDGEGSLVWAAGTVILVLVVLVVWLFA